MHPRYSTPLAFLLALVSSVSAFAQGPSAVSSEPRWYLAAVGGAVAGPPAPVLGAEIAERVGRHAEVYVTMSYFENLMRQSLRDDLDAAAARLTTLTGDGWSFSGRDRGLAVVAGAKYAFGTGAVRPYVGGGAGVINLKRSVTDTRVGDVTQAVFNDFNLGESDLSTTTEGISRPMLEALFGVQLGGRRTYFDIGYRYRSAFRLADQLDFSQLALGIGVRF
jgi:hypothetical protein